MTLKEAIETGKPFKLPNETRWRHKSDGTALYTIYELVSVDWVVDVKRAETDVRFKHMDTKTGSILEEQMKLIQVDDTFSLNNIDGNENYKLYEDLGDIYLTKVNCDNISITRIRCLKDEIPYLIALLTQYEKHRQNTSGKFVSIGGL